MTFCIKFAMELANLKPLNLGKLLGGFTRRLLPTGSGSGPRKLPPPLSTGLRYQEKAASKGKAFTTLGRQGLICN